MSKIIVKEQNSIPHIDGRMCTYQTEEIRADINSIFDVNSEFALPRKYKVVITPMGRAKICLKIDPFEDKALTVMQLLYNATGASFEDEKLALHILAENFKKL